MTSNPEKLEPDVPAPDPAPMPSPTFYSELATSLMVSIDTVTAAVPDFDNPLRFTNTYVRSKKRVPKAFVVDAVKALLVSGELQRLKIPNAAEVLDDKYYIDAFGPLVKHLEAALKGLKFTVDVREARLAANAQKIYATAKLLALAEDRDATTMNVHVDSMKRARRTTSRPAAQAAKKEVPATAGQK